MLHGVGVHIVSFSVLSYVDSGMAINVLYSFEGVDI